MPCAQHVLNGACSTLTDINVWSIYCQAYRRMLLHWQAQGIIMSWASSLLSLKIKPGSLLIQSSASQLVFLSWYGTVQQTSWQGML